MKIYLFFFLIIISCNNKKTDNVKNQQNNILTKDTIGKNKLKLPEKIFNNDEKSAIEIAEIEWNNSYGKEMIDKEKPLIAEKINDSIYSVRRSQKKPQIGGVAFGEVDVKNKKMLKYSHGE